MKNKPEKKMIGGALTALLGVVVVVFLGMHSINFFKFTFPAEQQLFAWLGFGLTGGAGVVYLVKFITDANTPLKRVIALTMMVVSISGEIATAFYGIQVKTWEKLGFTLTETDYQNMLTVVMGLALAHAVAMIAYLAGDRVAWMFGDQDKDGIPDGWDDTDNRTNKPFQQTTRSYAKDTEKPDLPS